MLICVTKLWGKCDKCETYQKVNSELSFIITLNTRTEIALVQS